jgi:hypothetical protein
MNNLSSRQRRFVTSLLAGNRIERAAKAAGITRKTAFRYLSDHAVRQALSEVVDVTLAQVARQVVTSMGAAASTLVEIHQDPGSPAASRVAAARAILVSGPRLHEFADLCRRVIDMERMLEKAEGRDDPRQL